ncbi:hypothetical protein QYM36_010717 [Artemia franciscana]|uniref:HTH psq-type domain-containing protein n=1 Tax=Artemia franciscana TaxID=6661 RepID=A0AA88HSC2_ARTSF|nr:hypothetical protein QYM36_010717 [Artemia franciscana]
MPRVPRSQMEAHRKDAVEQRAELEESTRQALNKVCGGHSVQKDAAMISIPKATLQGRYNSHKNLSDDQKLSACLSRKHSFVAVFSPNEEAVLAIYLITALNMCNGLTEPEVRKLAYQCALANEKKVPQA